MLGFSFSWQEVKKSWLLWLVLILFILVLVSFFVYQKVVFPRLTNCPFVSLRLCFAGEGYEKFNWSRGVARGYRLSQKEKIVAPFDGDFIYSPTGVITDQGQRMGKTPVLVFESPQVGTIKLYGAQINLLKGESAAKQKVSQGEVVAEVLPGGIDFLDNYNLVKVGPF
jgi:hypothetical protein